MIIEKIIAKKDDEIFLNYTIVKKEGKASTNNLELFIDAIRSSIFKDIFDYENSSKLYSFGLSDEWNVEYGDKNKEYYIKLYDYFLEEDATKDENGFLCVDINQINGLKIKSRENLFKLIEAWQLIVKTRPRYIIVTQDDIGWINVNVSDEINLL
ncbi:hypothetical protein HYV10_01580 [Candidatus Dependentiae bacterium]|nr:hypothetical protein [Candidatus Dependentiae bacterium]